MFAGNRTSKTISLAPLALLLAIATLASARADEPPDPPGRVARVNLVLGTVSTQPAGSESWLSDVLNRPLTNGDKLWSDRESRAELHIGSAAVRLGSETGVGILNIDDRTVQLRLTAGTLQIRVRALEPEQTFEIATPTASVAVLRPGQYRIEVGDSGDQLRIAVAQGQVAVTDQGHAGTVEAGQFADYSAGAVDQPQIESLPPGDAFDQWVADRDRREDRAVATRYVSREVIGYEDLDDYGSWRTVDEYGPVWVPAVTVGWAPYRYGHWGWIAPWGWTWIDDAPWGFAPFHYGRWVSVGGAWCWAPGPRRYAPVYAPALVGWVGGSGWSVGISVGGPPVGWFPLGWNEVYMPGYRVSNNYVRNVNVTNIHVTNTTINNYITNNTTIVNGATAQQRAGDERRSGGAGGVHYANLAVPGAVTATTRAAFTTAQPVAKHLESVPHDALEHATAGTVAPAIAPTSRSLGRAAAAAPRVTPEAWSRPVVARTAPPPPPPSFEAQRHAVIANGGRPVPAHAGTGPRTERADVIHVAPQPLPKTSPQPAAAGPTPHRELTAPGRAERPPQQPTAPGARPVERSMPAVPERAPAGREDRPMPHPAPAVARPVERPIPPPAPERTLPAREDRPSPPNPTAPVVRPVERSMPVEPERPPPVRQDRPPTEYRPPAEYRPQPQREVRPETERAPRPAPEYHPPTVREAAPPPPPARVAPPPPPPPPPPTPAPAPHEAHQPAPPHADKPAPKTEPHDK